VSSGSTDQATLNRILHLGHVGFIQKPYQTTALVEEVKRWLEA
jgi:FixJ family two-component response regulator